MTKETIDYPTRDLMKQGKSQKHSQGFRPLHTNFINNDESQGYRVTFVDGPDDPDNALELVAKRESEELTRSRNKELKEKAKNKSLTKDERDELLSKLAETL